ncbi:MAG: hypothetical protein WCH05_06625 [Chlorobiaceae bacterium]
MSDLSGIVVGEEDEIMFNRLGSIAQQMAEIAFRDLYVTEEGKPNLAVEQAFMSGYVSGVIQHFFTGILHPDQFKLKR